MHQALIESSVIRLTAVDKVEYISCDRNIEDALDIRERPAHKLGLFLIVE